MTPTTTTDKWRSENLGPRQAKMFKQTFGAFGWEAQGITELLDSGPYHVTPMMGPWQPGAAEILQGIRDKYDGLVTGDNYKAIIADLEAATVKLRETRPVIDKRTTPEERTERERATKEREAKAKAEADHLATLQRHNYGLAETAKAIVDVLKVLYPGTTFKRKSGSYSMGCSIHISWQDGPTEMQVKPILDIFHRTWFDGIDDSTHHIKAQEWNGHLFDFTGDSARGGRDHSLSLLRECAQRFSDETGLLVHIKDGDLSHPYIEREGGACGYSFYSGVPAGAQPEDYPNGCITKDDYSHSCACDVVNTIVHHTSKEQPAVPFVTDWPENEPEPTNSVRAVVFGILLNQVGQSKPMPSGATEIRWCRNEAKGGIEIVFPGKPERAVLDDLKAHGWRWSFSTKCWYKKQSADAIAFAQALGSEIAK